MMIPGAVRSAIQLLAARFNLRIERKYEFGPYWLNVLELAISQANPRDPDFFFVQVGANDGLYSDPISHLVAKYQWRGVLLEPQPAVFERLVHNYERRNGLMFENAALAHKDGEMQFWTVPGDTGRSSFKKETLRRDGFTDDAIVECKVKTITAKSLLSKYAINRIDLLQVDTEGFDFEVVKMIIGTGIKPRIINYEHLHLSPSDRTECVEMLGRVGYKMWRSGAYGIDTIAVLSELPLVGNCDVV